MEKVIFCPFFPHSRKIQELDLSLSWDFWLKEQHNWNFCAVMLGEFPYTLNSQICAMDMEILCHFLGNLGCIEHMGQGCFTHLQRVWCSPGTTGLFCKFCLFTVPFHSTRARVSVQEIPDRNGAAPDQLLIAREGLSGFGSCWLAGIY